MNKLYLKARVFEIVSARICGSIGKDEINCWIEIETKGEVFDGENWQPSVYHQGLTIPGKAWSDLIGKVVAWDDPKDPSYEHPEIGCLYVFGHELITHSKLRFGTIRDHAIDVEWSGVADVSWDDAYGTNVPFTLKTSLEIVEQKNA